MRFTITRSQVALAGLALFAACEQPPSPLDPDYSILSVSVTPALDTLRVGGSVQLSAVVLMSNHRPPRPVTWSSSTPGVGTPWSTASPTMPKPCSPPHSRRASPSGSSNEPRCGG